jgi:magnesium chelatase family protein
VATARAAQRARFDGHAGVALNADAEGDLLDAIATLEPAASDLLAAAAAKFRLSARGYHRVLRVARTIADLAASDPVLKPHVAEAIGYRLAF